MTIQQQQPLPLKAVMVWKGQIGDKWERDFSFNTLIFVDDENITY